MDSQIHHSILCDAADAITAAVHANPDKARTGTLQVKGFTDEQIKQGTDFAVRLGFLYEVRTEKSPRR